jgi:pimeloyl-ACP methyl ester carboxylesterase
MGLTNCNGTSISFRCTGEGTDVVLIHGLAANQAFWHHAALIPLTKKYRVTTFDLRGHGYNPIPKGGYTTADMAEDLHHLLNHLNIEKAHLVGHSFGGVIALHYAVLHPERVFSLSIADSRVRALQPIQCPKEWPYWNALQNYLKGFGIDVPDDEAEPGLFILEKLATLKRQQIKEGSEMFPLFIPFCPWGRSSRSAARWLKMLRNTTIKQDVTSISGLTREKLSTITHHTLAIYGEFSLALPSFEGLRLLLSNCEPVIIPGTGHFFPLNMPKQFASLLRKFFKVIETSEEPCAYLSTEEEKGKNG